MADNNFIPLHQSTPVPGKWRKPRHSDQNNWCNPSESGQDGVYNNWHKNRRSFDPIYSQNYSNWNDYSNDQNLNRSVQNQHSYYNSPYQNQRRQGFNTPQNNKSNWHKNRRDHVHRNFSTCDTSKSQQTSSSSFRSDKSSRTEHNSKNNIDAYLHPSMLEDPWAELRQKTN